MSNIRQNKFKNYKEERRPRKRICHKGRPIIIDYCNLFYRNLFNLDPSLKQNNFFSLIPQVINNQYFQPTLIYPANPNETLMPHQYFQVQQQLQQQQQQIIEQQQYQANQKKEAYERQQRYYQEQQKLYFEYQQKLYEEEQKRPEKDSFESKKIYQERQKYYQEQRQRLYLEQQNLYFEHLQELQQEEVQRYNAKQQEKQVKKDNIEEYLPRPFDIIGKGNSPSIIHKGDNIEVIQNHN